MPNFSTPLSGLDSSQQALSIVANNLANMNTVGYKDEQVNFQDLFYQALGTNGAGDTLQVGGGASVASISGNFTSGTIASTGVPTDVAINGTGFLVTQLNGQTEYTRAGNLQVDSNGMLTTQSGQFVMGYPASNGVVSTGSLTPLQVGTGMVVPATATTTFQLNTNLNADATVGTTYSNPITVYDSLGSPHTLTLTFTNTDACKNNWSYIATIPVLAGGTATPATVGSGTLMFDANGNIMSANGAPVSSSAPDVTGMDLSGFLLRRISPGRHQAGLVLEWVRFGYSAVRSGKWA